MLDVITDFWKPVKKNAPQEKPDLEQLRIGSQLTFGTVPQAIISGRMLKVSAVNTYQFGEERMTSFLLSQDKDDSVSMIVASAEGEQYLAISRRIAFADRMRMFDPAELEAVVEQPDAARLNCKEIDASWKHWIVTSYKKEISGLKGAFTKGDLRDKAADGVSQPFDYLLLTSDNNEYAIEIERYADGRLELYATVYRRVTDIIALDNASSGEPRLSTGPALETSTSDQLSAPAVLPPAVEEETVKTLPTLSPVKMEEPKPVTPPTLAPAKPVEAAAPAIAPTPEAPRLSASTPFIASPTIATTLPKKETAPMSAPTSQTNGAMPYPASKAPLAGASANAAQEALKKEIKAVTNHAEMENDAIECDLRVANKVIEEAIRNEMRLSDVVRRIIALPVANPESVHIPVTLNDSDFALLAIRYGMSAADRNAIKMRIIEEINDFSGNGKKQ